MSKNRVKGIFTGANFHRNIILDKLCLKLYNDYDVLNIYRTVKMKIAICDLDERFTSRLKSTLYRYAENNRMEILAECFESGEDMISSTADYNLIFLGYRLKGINGLETAKFLRASQNFCPIIFISDCTHFILEAFKVNAFRFLLKSKWEQELLPALDDFFINAGKDYPLWIKTNEDIICISTDDIYYLEADNKYCFIHLGNETISCHKTMARVFSALPTNHFAKVSRAFVVNFNHISRYNNQTIILKNGKILHPSRNYYKSFKDEYRRFLKPYEI